MKRLLIVLFGVLAFQGSVWADSCLKNWPPDEDSVAIARILFPVEDEQVISKKSSFGLVWHEKDAIGESLGGKVNIRLYERGKETRDLFNNRLQNKNNTGFFLINKKDFSAAKVIADKEYYFEVQGAGKAGSKARIHSGCFTFDVKQREDLQCDSATKMKECIKVLVAQNNSALARISALEERLDASENSGASGSTIINQNTAHSHSEYAEEGHRHNFASSLHSHDNYANKRRIEALQETMLGHISYHLNDGIQAGGTDSESQVADPGGDAGSVADEVPDTSASTGSDSESRAADSGGTGTGWLTGGPEGECRHDEDGVWAPGMNWEECIGVKWNAANGYDDVDSNPICWSLGGTTAEFFNIEPQYEDMWVVGRAEGTRWAPGKRSEYLCRTACAMIGGPRGCRDTSVGWAMPRTEWESIRTYCEINRMTTPGRSEGEVVVILRSRLREKCCHQIPNLNGCE